MKRGSIRRIYELDRMIRLGKLESAEQAAQKLEVSTRTIERDLDQLRGDLGAELVYSRDKGRYEYAGNPFVLPAQWLKEREIAILLIAERALKMFTSTSFESEIHPAFNKLLGPIRHDKEAIAYISDLCKSVCFLQPVEPLRDMQKEFSIVLDAIMDRQRLGIVYTSARKPDAERREIDPYALINNGGEWYVVGLCKRSNTIKSFVLSQINEPQAIDHYFEMPDKFEAKEYFGQAFDRMHGGAAESVELEISLPAAAWVGRNRWHGSQKIRKLGNGTIALSMTCPITDSLARWVLQMGECVTIKAPAELREMVAKKAEAMVNNNSIAGK